MTMHTITYAINYWSKVNMLRSLRHRNVLHNILCPKISINFLLWQYNLLERIISKILNNRYFLKGQIQAMFLRHEGYLGAIGAFLKGVEEEGKCVFNPLSGR